MKVTKILVVEDSKLVRMMYDVMLQRCSVVHACDGQEALVRLGEQSDFDAVLLDLNMPRMNGFEFLSVIKADPRLAHLPVVVVTTEGHEDFAQRAMQAGASAYLTKPFRAETVLETLEKLSQSQGR